MHQICLGYLISMRVVLFSQNNNNKYPIACILQVFFKNDNGSTLVWFRTRDQGPEWKDAHVNLPAGEGSVLIEATRGVGYRGDVAIDDISSRTGHCPSHGEECSCVCVYYIHENIRFNYKYSM